ncbi:HNH endonuclease [Pseudoalteromonas phage H101]|uniref:Uncharacterized protein n=1 Tax=Pseudoalteromonas phage H101 TaxID=1654919 RepID=A0A0H4J234_9CAUD|nr:HNH endonuclease [Pseudoalteromonas phage H101]AKO60970.1 hypothetical protein [Pseudoalteromonas phage H101]
MIRRCYSRKWQEKYPTYKGYKVCEEWWLFSSFKRWMKGQDWINKQINKDCIYPNSKVYSPENCTFVEVQLNKLLNYRTGVRGVLKQGVSLNPRGGYVAQCNNGKGKVLYIGTFPTEAQAYEAYVTYKHALILQVADEQEDIRVKNGLLLHAQILLDTLEDA